MYAEINNGKIMKKVHPGGSYKNISFGTNATRDEYIQAGLYELIEITPEISEYEIHGNSVITLDNTTKTATVTKEVLEVSIDFAKKRNTEKINMACESAIVGGFPSSALGAEHTYQSEREDQLNLVGVVSSGVDQLFKCSADAGNTWEWKLHTAAQLKQVLKDGAAVKSALLQTAQSKKASISTAQSVAEVASIIW